MVCSLVKNLELYFAIVKTSVPLRSKLYNRPLTNLQKKL